MKRAHLVAAAAILCAQALTAPAWSEAAVRVNVSPEQTKRLGVETAIVRRVEQAAVAELPARVVASRSGANTAVAPFAGAVTRVHVLAGQAVKAGDPIAAVASRDFAENQSGLVEARSQAQIAEAVFARAKTLKEEGLISGASLQDAEAEAKRARAMLAEHERFARSAGEGAANEAGAYIVRAPVAGRVSSVSVRAGDMVEALSPVASIATGDGYWVEIQAPARLAGRIGVGDAVEFGPELRGEILSVGGAIDPMTRSIAVTASAPDAAGLRLGEMIRVRILGTDTAGAQFEAPGDSVIRVDGEDVVFVAVDSGFQLVPVDVLGRTSSRVIVSGKLQAGAQVAASGLTELKAIALTEGE